MLNAWRHARFFDSIRWLSLFTVALVMVWVFAARYAGRQFAEMEAREDAAVTAG